MACVAAVLVAVALWRWHVTTRKNEQLLLDAQQMNEMHQFEEPLLAFLPEALQPVAVRDMRGQVTDLAMVGRGAFGTLISINFPLASVYGGPFRIVIYAAWMCVLECFSMFVRAS